jgi:membrane-bound lytic murein transglycosylase A
LLFAQDTGSAIVGPARADIYFGHGEEISHIAGRIKQHGQFVMLAPQSVAVSGAAVAAATDIPLPKPRPMTVTAAARAIIATTANVPAPLPKPRP